MSDDRPVSAAEAEPFAKPPPEVTRYFEAKGIHPTFHWQDMGFDEHAMAFTVAKSAGFDILEDVRQAVSAAIEGRQDFDTFRKGLEPLLKAKGWWGQKDVVDPQTGETMKAQLGSARRLRTIYDANTRTAYAAGQWERQWRTRRVLPYLLYLISTAERKRPLHLSWVGTILPIESPWWETHYPPNGWHCQCRVRQISDAEAKRRGYDPDAPPSPPDDGFEMFLNKRSGEYVKVPNGIDPGWGQNPGKTRTRNAADFLAGKLDAASPEARRIAVGNIVGQPLFDRIAQGRVPFDPAERDDQANEARGRVALPVAVLPDDLKTAIGADSSIVRLSVADGVKQAEKRLTAAGGLPMPPPDHAIVQRLVDRAEAIRYGKSGLVVQGEVEGKRWMAVVRRAASALGEIYLKSLRRQTERQGKVYRTRGTIIRPPVERDEDRPSDPNERMAP